MTRSEAPDGMIAVAPDGLPEVAAGTDLVGVIAEHVAGLDWPDGGRGIRAGDIVVVTSKIVAKAEGRTMAGRDRRSAEAADTARIVASIPGGTAIVRTRHGLVLAAAGVDTSNAGGDRVVLLPADPDASAEALRLGLQDRLGARPLGVIVSDTMGRPWREGQTDCAIGAAGVLPLRDLSGTRDADGVELQVTAPATADEVAAAAELVMGKTARRPVAVVRGLHGAVTDSPGPGARALVRSEEDDLFTLGTAEAREEGRQEAIANRRTVRRFLGRDVPADLIRAAVADAVLAPAPHHTTPWRFVQVVGDRRQQLLDAMAGRWRRDLAELDGYSAAAIAKRLRRGDVLREAPVLMLPFVTLAGAAHAYPDAARRSFERDLFVLAGGAGVQNFMISVAARGAASAWVSSTVFCPDVVRDCLELPADWQPLGAVAVGFAEQPPAPRPARAADEFLRVIG